MILKSIKLNNIRSYLNQEIEFPDGSVLLAGDIGSGKSTILQAVEFALFGIKRGELSGGSLLRHGKREGYVELRLVLDGKEITIKRNLKRAKNDIKQEAGYIIIDDKKREGTAVELKTAVFDLLGYPKSLISKSKDLVYRYTVYTPQEEMKQILFEGRDTRLDTLRRVFGIDKYKRVRENSTITIKEIKENIRVGENVIEDLEDKRKEKKAKEEEIEKLRLRISGIVSKLNDKKRELSEKELEIRDVENNLRRLNELKRELVVNEANLGNYLDKRKNNNEKLRHLESEIKGLEREKMMKIDINEIKGGINEKENGVKLMETTLKEITLKLGEVEINSRNSEEMKKKIKELDICPVCQQKVTLEHKQGIIERENKLIGEMKKNLVEYKKREKEAAKRLEALKKELETLKEEERNFELTNIKLRNLEEKNKEKGNLEKDQEEIKKKIGDINIKKIELNKGIGKLGGIEKDYEKIKKRLEDIREEYHKIELEKVSLEKEIEGIQKLAVSLEKEIEKKLMVKDRLKNLKELRNWFEELFINLMSTMERQVMLRLYSEFNELFQQWFKILIEDETINTRLDEEFTPIIEQNGYETGLENLSGGERTSLALAYRLSLNKVINDFIEGIKTKDIIILDEPTDGFSTEQLDKVRDVIEQLNTRQIIIVSHESKIESFVDNVIRIRKDEHISSVT